MIRMPLLLAAIFIVHSLALFLLFPGSYIATCWPWIPQPFGFELYFYGSTTASLGLNAWVLHRYWPRPAKARIAWALGLSPIITFASLWAGAVAALNTYGS